MEKKFHAWPRAASTSPSHAPPSPSCVPHLDPRRASRPGLALPTTRRLRRCRIAAPPPPTTVLLLRHLHDSMPLLRRPHDPVLFLRRHAYSHHENGATDPARPCTATATRTVSGTRQPVPCSSHSCRIVAGRSHPFLLFLRGGAANVAGRSCMSSLRVLPMKSAGATIGQRRCCNEQAAVLQGPRQRSQKKCYNNAMIV
jgi:hypothetical protein